jgi:hypothetical protein
MRYPPSPQAFHSGSIQRYRVLPQKILNPPYSERMIQSIWFKSASCDDRDTFGVSLVDMLLDDVENYLYGANDEVFKDIVSNDAIRFNILVGFSSFYHA